MVKNLYDYLAKPDKTIGEHVEDLLYRANILRKLGYKIKGLLIIKPLFLVKKYM